LYLILIPFFAILYTFLPGNSFHDSNIQHESTFAADGNRDRAELAGWIGYGARTKWTSEHVHSELVPSLVRVGKITNSPLTGIVLPERNDHYTDAYSTAGLLFEASGIVHLTGHELRSDQGFAYFVRAGYPRTYTCDVSHNGRLVPEPFVLYTVGYRNPDGTSPRTRKEEREALDFPPVSYMFDGRPCEHGLPVPPSEAGSLLIPLALDQRINHFFAEEGGDPAYASDPFFRMLYVSATSIATLGMGDITPVSNTARLLIALEAVLGIVFIGLFLNAVAARWRA
jgi:hypothetical protein